ncbi:O-antigen ligase family protein [Rhodococcus sp. C26F]
MTVRSDFIAVAIGVVAALLAGFATAAPSYLAVFGLLILLILIALLPQRILPSLALIVFALVPVAYMGYVPFMVGRYITPSLVIILIWLLRVPRGISTRQFVGVWKFISALLVAWLLYSSYSGIDSARSYAWSFVFCVLFIGVGLVASRVDVETVKLLIRTWLWLAVGLGSLAIVEGLAGFSIFRGIYASGGGFEDRWSVNRITTLLGHPLMNGTFFATAGSFALLMALRRRDRLAWAAAAFSALAVLFSVSRSATIALIVGVAVGVLLVLFTKTRRRGVKVSAISAVVVGTVGLVSSPLLRERSASEEGSSSAEYRADVTTIALEISEKDGYMGSGPGTSNLRVVAEGYYLPIENSFLGLLTSLGIPGLLLVIGLLACALLVAVRRRRFEVAAGWMAYVVAVAAWPVWENNPGSFLIGSILIILSFAPSLADEIIGPKREASNLINR